LAKYFFEVFDRLPQLSTSFDPSKSPVERGPRSLQLWALLALHVFVREGVDVAILETHTGGEYDATNVVTKPLVTAVTALGVDHVEMLGPTIENIAWHKSGIYKPGAVALSTTQDAVPAKMLEQRAGARGCRVTFVDEDQRLPAESIQLQPAVQRKNASLAIAIAQAYLQNYNHDLTEPDIRTGIEQWSWPGRFQIVTKGKHTWFLDSAHNAMSVALAAEWFVETSTALHRPLPDVNRILIFSHINELRDGPALLGCLAEALKARSAGIKHVIFSTYDEVAVSNGLSTVVSSRGFCEVWRKSQPHTQVWNEPTVQGAIRLAEELAEGGTAHILVTGSDHLVGPALNILQP